MNDHKPFHNLTIVGRVWATTCLLAGTFAFIAYLNELVPNLPTGQYPIVWFLIPIVLGTLAVFGLGNLLFRLIGIKVWQMPREDSVSR